MMASAAWVLLWLCLFGAIAEATNCVEEELNVARTRNEHDMCQSSEQCTTGCCKSFSGYHTRFNKCSQATEDYQLRECIVGAMKRKGQTCHLHYHCVSNCCVRMRAKTRMYCLPANECS
ncbi:hypothetical protein ACOMHN_001066 [Nucella lapillus]